MNRQISQATILIVEDDRLVVLTIEMKLRKMGYTVAGSARTGADAFRQAEELCPDIILIDIDLGEGKDGVETADLIRRLLNIPVVYLTAHSEDATLQRAKLTETYGYVLKPVEEADLKIAIEIGLHKAREDRQVKKHEQLLPAILDSMGDGVIATDGEGRVQFLNSLAERLTGWPREEAVGRDVREIFTSFHAWTREPVPNQALVALTRDEVVPLTGDTILVSRDRTKRRIVFRAAPMRNVNGTIAGAVLVFQECTEQKRSEENLRKAQKLEDMGRFAGGIAMEFYNSLTVINGYSEILRENDFPLEERNQYLDELLRAGKILCELTNKILVFSRKQVLDTKVVNLNAIVVQIGELSRRLIGENIHFVINPADDSVEVRVDPLQIEPAILSLIINARDAMPTGGRLELSTANAVLDAQTVREYPDVTPGRYAMLSVSDTGTGMSPEVLSRVFEPFCTTKGVHQGPGFGLATLYGFVKQSGGHVDVTSAVGVGTTFRIYLPIFDEPQPIYIGETKPVAKGGNETIILVESNEKLRQMTKQNLQQHGYTVLEASNEDNCIEVSLNYLGPIHLLITDCMMPQMNGGQFAEILTAICPGVRVLFMSGYTTDSLFQNGVELSAADVLHKPFRLDALRKKIRKVLDRP